MYMCVYVCVCVCVCVCGWMAAQWQEINDFSSQRPLLVINPPLSSRHLSSLTLSYLFPLSKDVSRHIFLFLDSYETMDRKLRGEGNGKKAKIVTAPNFLALLNLPHSMLHFGPLRLLWEGDSKGEGILRTIKPLIHGLVQNWALNAMKAWYRWRALERIARQFEQTCNDGVGVEANDGDGGEETKAERTNSDPRERGARYRAFHTYTEDKARGAFATSAALSVICMEDGSFGMAIKGGKVLKLLKVDGGAAAEACGAAYWGWTLAPGPAEDIDLAQEGAISHTCLFLRHLDQVTGEPVEAPHFYVITSEWLEMLSSGEFGLPHFPGATY